MKGFLLGVLCLSVILASETGTVGEVDLRESVVKIHTTVRQPNPFRPWAKQSPKEASGSGLVIEGHRILTNAHVIDYASQIYVQGYQDADKVSAKVVAVARGMDLAVLEVDNKDFFAKRPPLTLAKELPRVQEKVDAYGYPLGGEEMSVTNGIISRIEMADYRFGVRGLRIQVDAALNPGNSGGPAIAGGKVVGVVFSGIPSAENTGYLIPIDEVQMFLDDIKDGRYDGKPRFHSVFQLVQNNALRDKLKLKDDVAGVMATSIAELDDNPLQRFDIITHIGPHNLDNEGQVHIREDLRVSGSYWVPKLAKDGNLDVTVFREGKSIAMNVPVAVETDRLIPSLNGAYPRFFIYGPVVFTPVTQEFVAAAARFMGTLAQVQSPIVTRIRDNVAFEGEELVVVASPFLSHAINKDYENPMMQVVEKVNGTKVKNLKHLVETLRDTKEEFVTFEFAGLTRNVLVFRRSEIADATDEILTDNGIRYQSSKDLRDVWEAE